jgi:hypothetical protein
MKYLETIVMYDWMCMDVAFGYVIISASKSTLVRHS